MFLQALIGFQRNSMISVLSVLTNIVRNKFSIGYTSCRNMVDEISAIRRIIGFDSCWDVIIISGITVRIAKEKNCRHGHILSLCNKFPCLKERYHQQYSAQSRRRNQRSRPLHGPILLNVRLQKNEHSD